MDFMTLIPRVGGGERSASARQRSATDPQMTEREEKNMVLLGKDFSFLKMKKTQ